MVDIAPPFLDKYIAQGANGAAEEFRLSSHFQPIFSLAHRRPVGYEGLIRALDSRGGVVRPYELFAKAPHGEARITLDRQCRAVHVRNFQKLGNSRSWLFLNVDPQVATEGPRIGSFFSEMLESNDFPAHRVAVELIETPFEDEGRLTSAVEYYRKLGCLIVIDDFGAGYSNFDRIWGLRPDIVKIDREMTRRVTVEPLARRMFTGIISVLHEAGALVCVEGIETEGEALCAIDANADLIQGDYFAAGGPELLPENARSEVFERLITGHRADFADFQKRQHTRLVPYLAAIKNAVQDLSLGADFQPAAQGLLKLPSAQRCYLIGGDGLQIGANVEAESKTHAQDQRFEVVQPSAGTDWQTKPYFRRAIETPGKVQITRPYLSVLGPKLCVTLSFAFEASDGTQQVLCVDLDFASLAGEDIAFGVSSLHA
ncbi:MAG TPA: EAL domain-containing protein [Burkholderiales bacterium]|nr:EAL domain-containing protein [Burkholderiales bacterium]